MGSFSHLVTLSIALGIGTLAFAFLPLLIRLPPKAVSAVSQCSVGVLVGAALTVVIPEGVSAVFEASEHGSEHGGTGGGDEGGGDGTGHGHGHGNAGWIGAALLAGFILMYIIDSLHGHDEYPSPSSHPHSHSHSHSSTRRPLSRTSSHSSFTSRLLRPSYRPTPSHLAELEPLSHGAARDSNEYSRPSSPLRANGEAGGAGNVWNDDPDVEAGRGTSSPPPAATPPHNHPHPLGRARSSYHSGSPSDPDEVITADASSVSTVIGLVAHSLADGISLGASSLSSSSSSSSPTTPGGGSGNGSLQLIVFLSIILHKAPTAFALSSLLSSSPATSPSFVRRALLLFSLAAPVGAVVTYSLLSLLGQRGEGEGEGEEGAGLAWWTGLALVFSGGTFLFVATHAVKEQEKKAARACEAGHQHTHEGDGLDEEGGQDAALSERARLGLVIGGMVLPGVLSRVVGHGH